MQNWIFNKSFDYPSENQLQLVKDKILESSQIEINIEKHLKSILKIVYHFANNPWISQEEIIGLLNIDKSSLKILNEYIRENTYLQNLIIKGGSGYKYWQTISPFCSKINDAIDNSFSYPMRIGIYPGVSCMYYCGFCGRNQDARYPSNIVEDGYKMFESVLSELDPKNSAISISGGLEPLTNPKLGDIVDFASDHGLRVPLITNGHSLTEKNVLKNKGLKKLDSIRISLYGVDEKSYEFITTLKNSYKTVKKNCINFLKFRNDVNPKIKFGINYIILKENINDLPKLTEFISEVNSAVDNGAGIDFLSLRDDFDTVTGISDKSDSKKKYHLGGLLNYEDRQKLIYIFNELERDSEIKKLHVDYGYALYAIKNGLAGTTLKKICDKEMRKYAHTQMSVCVDLFGDVFLYREAGFLDRPGNKKFIIGRVNKNNSLKNIIEDFLYNSNGLENASNDIRFMDPFDHVLTSLINQAENDKKFGIPFKYGPVKLRVDTKNINVGNSWYKDV